MPTTVPNVYLQDSGGGVWLLGATGIGAYTTTPVTSPTSGLPFVLLQDQAAATVWAMTVSTVGALTITAAAGTGAASIPVISTTGTLLGIVVIGGYISVISVTLCQFTLAQAFTALAQRLYDPTNQFWTQAELLLYIQEAFRTWNALTAYWRGDFLFNTVAGTTWYDITSTTVAPNTLRPLTLSTTSLYTIIEYHLLEPPVGAGTWAGSAQFALSDIQMAVERRRSELLGATGCSLTQSLLPATPGRTTLPATTLDVRRIAFLPAPGFGSPVTLWQDDTWAWESFEHDYTTLPPGVPSTYGMNTQPLLSFDVDVALAAPGLYELLTTQSVADPALAVPDDWAWLIKWGALADLLGRESNAKDPLRTKYAEQRYQQGMSLLALAPAVLAFRVNNVPALVDSVRSSDEYDTGWEGAAAGAPTTVLAAGLNLVALSPKPDAGPYSLTATVVENAPVPLLLSDCLTLTTDVFEAILDYAQHLATFKQGGAEFMATMPLYQRFMSMATLYASRIAEMGEFTAMLQSLSALEAGMNPRFTADTPAEVAGG
jgi:hypothetical protein